MVNDVLEVLAICADRFRRRGQLQAKLRIEFVDRFRCCLCAVSVRFVHQHHQIGMPRKDVEIALAQGLSEGPDAALLLVDLVDVEDVDHRLAQLQAGGVFPVLAGDDCRRVLGEFCDALEHVFRARWATEILQQLGVDRRVGGKHEEVAAAPGEIEIGDECAHQPRLADTRCQRETERGELALEAFHAGIERLDFLQQLLRIVLATPIDKVSHFG